MAGGLTLVEVQQGGGKLMAKDAAGKFATPIYPADR